MKRSDVVNAINNLSGEIGHKWIVDTYNSISPRPRDYKLQNKDPWCAATVSAVLHACGDDTIAECYCPSMIIKAKNAGIWVEKDSYVPKPGDVIMYDWQDSGHGDGVGVADHTGIVISCDGKTITVREGNKNNSLGDRQIKVNGRYIRGFITPQYEEEYDMPQIKKGDKGKAVAIWQLIVGCHPDGIFEDNTDQATKIFQRDNGLTVDGIVGSKTWAKGLDSVNK